MHSYGIIRFITVVSVLIQSDQKVSMHLPNNPHTIDELKMAITRYIQNVDRAILNTVFFQRCNVIQYSLLLPMLYMFQAVSPPIIRNSKLYTQHLVYDKLACCYR